MSLNNQNKNQSLTGFEANLITGPVKGKAIQDGDVNLYTSETSEEPLLQIILKLVRPIQAVFSIRKRTKQAKTRVEELQTRVMMLQASIEAAKGQSQAGQRFDRMR